MDYTVVCSCVLFFGVNYYERLNQHLCQTLHQASSSLHHLIDFLWGSGQVCTFSSALKSPR